MDDVNFELIPWEYAESLMSGQMRAELKRMYEIPKDEFEFSWCACACYQGRVLACARVFMVGGWLTDIGTVVRGDFRRHGLAGWVWRQLIELCEIRQIETCPVSVEGCALAAALVKEHCHNVEFIVRPPA